MGSGGAGSGGRSRFARHAGEAATCPRAPAGHRAVVHGVVRERERQMTVWGAREHHRFEAAGKPFVYLVPSAAIFELDEAADAVLQTLRERPRTRDELVAGTEVPGGDGGFWRGRMWSTPRWPSLRECRRSPRSTRRWRRHRR